MIVLHLATGELRRDDEVAMLLDRPIFHRIVTACALWVALAAYPGSASAGSRYAGVYESPTPTDANAPASPLLAISLGPDGSATVTQDCGKGAVTTFGRWTDNGGQITVTFNAMPGSPAPAPMVFNSSHDGLQAVAWDHGTWGKLTPPPLKKEASNWHSRKHSLL